MENAGKTVQENSINDTVEIIKPIEQQADLVKKDNQLQAENLQQQNLQEQEEDVNQNQTSDEKEQHVEREPQTIEYCEDEDDDDDEKETSQKLVIDIPDEEEEEKDEEEEDGVLGLCDLQQEVSPKKEESEKITPKPEVDGIIALSDGEEDLPANEVASKPGKVQKRRSMGAGTANEEEQYRLKRRKINVAGAPKLPLTGYVRYMHDRRESLRKEHPTKTHMEHNKMIGEEWHSLPSDIKASYLKAADIDKQRYVKELHTFLKSRPDILASELAKNKIRKTADNNSPHPPAASTSTATKTIPKEKPQSNENSKTTKDNTKDKMAKEFVPIPSTSQQAMDKVNNEKKRKRTPTPPTSNTNTTNASSSTAVSTSTSSSSFVTPTPGEIPIFTNEFLEHNKIYDMELRSLRKSKTDLEQQNSVLEKHVENMKFGVEKMITENNELEEKNRLLEIYLDKLKRKLALALSTLPLPSAPHGATIENIDKYMQDLYKMSTSNSTGPATLNKAKDIIRKLDLQIHF